ncbi:hypothetical protein ACMFMF_003473 [Clarireedia jacksonii]
MKVPAGLLGFSREVVKGEISLRGGDNKPLLEYGVEQVGNHITCYALTAEDDAIIPYISITSGTEEFVDIVVDGILRASHSNDKGTKKTTKNFDWVCGQIKQGNRYIHKAFQMQVAKRNTDQSRHHIDGTPSSAVGSVEFQIFRRDLETKKALKHRSSSLNSDNEDETSSSSQESSDTKRAPTYEEYNSWWKLNSFVGEAGKPLSPFEVGLVNQKNITSTAKARVLKNWPGDFKLWASFKFVLLSSTELQKLGFATVESYHGTPWNGAQSSIKKSINTKNGSSATKLLVNDDDHEDDDQSLVISASEDNAVESKTVKTKGKGIASHELQATSESLAKQSSRTNPLQSKPHADRLTSENLQLFDSSDGEMTHQDMEAEATTTSIVSGGESREIPVKDVQDFCNGDTVPEVLPEKLIPKTTKAWSISEFKADDTNSFAHLKRKNKPTSVSGIATAPPKKSSNDQNLIEPPSSHHGRATLSKLMTTGMQKNQNISSPSEIKIVFEVSQASKDQEAREERHSTLGIEPHDLHWEPLTPPQTGKLQGLPKFDTFNHRDQCTPSDAIRNNPSSLAHDQDSKYSVLNSHENSFARPNTRFDSEAAENMCGASVDCDLQNSSFEENLAVAHQSSMEIRNNLLIRDSMDVKFDDFIGDSGAGDEQMVDAPILTSNSTMEMKIDEPVSPFDSTIQNVPASEPQLVAEVMENTICGRTPLPESRPTHSLSTKSPTDRYSDDKPTPAHNPKNKMVTSTNTDKVAEIVLPQVPSSEVTSSKKTVAPAKPIKKEGKTSAPIKNTAIKPEITSSKQQTNIKAESAQAKPKKSATPKTIRVPKASNAATETDAKPSASSTKPKSKSKSKGKTEVSSTAAGKRKADQMTSVSNEAGPSKTNQSPASKHIELVERETAAAEARMRAAAEKKKLLEEHLQAAKDLKLQREKAQEINDRAKALEDENAALEDEILRLAAQ